MSIAEAMQPLQPFFAVVSFLLGTVVGSFGNVCVARWPHGESVVSPRSRCPKCRNGIAWYDNIPILSWLVLGAKCRNCGLPISWQYPLVEAITGALFLGVFLRFGFTLPTPIYMVLAAALVIVTFQDLADWTIPNEITFPGILAGPLLALVGMIYPESGLRVISPFDALAGVLVGGGILYSLDLITRVLLKKPGMGFGDVKLLAMLGGFLGWQGAIGTLMIASVIGTVIGLSMIGYFRMKGDAPAAPEEETPANAEPKPAKTVEDSEDEEVTLEGHYLPFGPYLAVGGLIYLFIGPELLAWYIARITLPPIVPGVTPLGM
jgi:leader peptidase (prepilin peptidase)/N-methyltransferase